MMCSSSTVAAGGRLGVIMSVNGGGFGANAPIHSFFAATANPGSFVIKGSELKFLNQNDTLRLNGFLDTATAASLPANANFDFLTIHELG